ncbi:MAG TPA: hypothetical protein VMA09_10100 [Candidatus Binataceae bacterium]|nr:hypothetical protein [Candidatus Binataceae bacterium]
MRRTIRAPRCAPGRPDIDRPALASVEQWYLQLSSRAAYRELVMIPFEDLRGRLAF